MVHEFVDYLSAYYNHESYPPFVRDQVVEWARKYTGQQLANIYSAVLKTFSRQYRCVPDIKVLEDALSYVPKMQDQLPPPRPMLPEPPEDDERVKPEEVQAMVRDLVREKEVR